MKKVEVKNEVKKIKENKIIAEFKEFISKGNVVDLAVGVIIGGAFQKIVTSLTDNIINPLLGCFTEVDFSEYILSIGTLNIRYGAFLTDVINFLIMAFVIFLIVKFMNRVLRKKEDTKSEEPQPKSSETVLLEEIRDLLKQK